MNRVKQLLSALRAVVTPQDMVFVDNWLSPAERELFDRMSLPDRRHCLNVAYTAVELAASSTGIDRSTLIKASLLHDVGRRHGDVSTTDKVIAVLSRALFGSRIFAWGKKGRGGKVDNLRHALYVSANHAQISAELLRAAGTETAVICLVADHHKPAATADSAELTLLRAADNLN